MSENKRLVREIQCAKCPWKKATNPRDIPNGYSEERHRGLKSTIAAPGVFTAGVRAMACHESKPGEEAHCIGWLMNQLGPGNNIGLRFQMLDYDLCRVRTIGPQHEHFEDTLPRRKRP